MRNKGDMLRNIFLAVVLLSNITLLCVSLPNEVWGNIETNFMIRSVMTSYTGDNSIFLSIEDTHHMPLFFLLQKMVSSAFDYHRWSFAFVPILSSCLCLVLLFLIAEKLYSRTAATIATLLLLCSFLHAMFSLEVEENVFFGMLMLVVIYLLLLVLKKKDMRCSREEVLLYAAFFLLGFTHNYFLFIYLMLIAFLALRTFISWRSLHKSFHQSKRLLVNIVVVGSIPVLFLLRHVNYYINSPAYLSNGRFAMHDALKVFDLSNYFWRNFTNIPTRAIRQVLPFADARYAFVILLLVLLVIIAGFFLVKDACRIVSLLKRKRSPGKAVAAFDSMLPGIFFAGIYMVMMSFFLTHMRYHAFYFLYLLMFLFTAYGIFHLYRMCERHKMLIHLLFAALIIIYCVCTCSWALTGSYREDLTVSVEPLLRSAEETLGVPLGDIRLYTNLDYVAQSYAVADDDRLEPAEAYKVFYNFGDPSFESYAQSYDTKAPLIVATMYCSDTLKDMSFNESSFPQRLSQTHELVDVIYSQSCTAGYLYRPTK